MATARSPLLLLLATVALLAAVSGGESTKEELWVTEVTKSLKETVVLLLAAKQKDPSLIYYIEDHNPGAWKSFVTGDGGKTPLHLAVEVGDPEVVAALLVSGAEINETDHYGRTPLHLAAELGRTEVVKTLVSAGGNVSVRVASPQLQGVMPLHLAAQGGHEGVVKELLRAGADPQALDLRGRTPSSYAARNQQADVMKLLIGAKPLCDKSREKTCREQLNEVGGINATGEGGMTLVHEAVLDNYELERSMSKEYAAWGARDWRGRTALHLAAGKDLVWTIELLIDAGAEVEAKDRLGRTPLHYATEREGTWSVPALLKAGADPNAVDWLGQTPLHLAAAGGSSEIVGHLLAAKADWSVRDRAERLPADLATSEKIRKLLPR